MKRDPEFKIRWEWEPAPSVKAPEHRATWARFEIQVGTEWVTLVEDRESGSSRHSVYGSLYPLAEWVAYNWWVLQADSRTSGQLSRYSDLGLGAVRALPRAQRDRHSIRSSGDGFAWPDLWITPDGRETLLIWDGDQGFTSDRPIRFLSRGEYRIDSEAVQFELSLLVSSVLTRLAEQGVSGTALEKEWAAIQATQPDEAEYCRAVARLGIDPYSAPEELESAILAASDALPGQLFSDFLDAVDPVRINEALNWVSEFSSEAAFQIFESSGEVLEVEDSPVSWDNIKELPASQPTDIVIAGPGHRGDTVIRLRTQMSGRLESISGRPWDVGREHARIVRDVADSGVLKRFRIQDYVVSATRKVSDRGLQALGQLSEGSSPFVVMGHRVRVKSVRFTLSRSLWHFIWDADPVFLVTGAYTDRQKTDRAFAAELLAPAEGIAELLHGEPASATQEELDEVAEHYGVSPMVISHQIQNQLRRAG